MPRFRITRARLLGAVAVKAVLGVALVVALGAAQAAPQAAGGASWFTTGIWVGVGIVGLIVLAFLLGRVVPKGKDDNPDSPL